MGATQQNLFAGVDAYGNPIPRPAPTPEPPVVALAARGDPVTSHEAAELVTKSAKAGLHRAIVLRLVHANPHSTGYELFVSATVDEQTELENPVEVYRKLNDLRHQGLVDQGTPRICTVRRRNMVTWSAVPQGDPRPDDSCSVRLA